MGLAISHFWASPAESEWETHLPLKEGLFCWGGDGLKEAHHTPYSQTVTLVGIHSLIPQIRGRGCIAFQVGAPTAGGGGDWTW